MAKADAQPTKSRICEATIAEIAERGWTGVRTRGVAKRAGVNNALVHYYFGSMQRLLTEATRASIAGIEADFGEFPVGSTLAEAMGAIVRGVSGYDLEDPRVVVLFEALLHTRRDDEIAQMIDGMLETYRSAVGAAITSGIEAGELDSATDAVGLATALTAFADGLALHRYAHPQLDVERAVQSVIALWQRGEPA